MKSIGSIVSILNDSLALVRLDKEIKIDGVLKVFTRVSADSISDLGLPYLYFPKGEIRITARQSENLYLAERFQQEKRSLSPTYPGLLDSLFVKEDVVPGPWSAEFDMASSINISIDKQVKVGDEVAE